MCGMGDESFFLGGGGCFFEVSIPFFFFLVFFLLLSGWQLDIKEPLNAKQQTYQLSRGVNSEITKSGKMPGRINIF